MGKTKIVQKTGPRVHVPIAFDEKTGRHYSLDPMKTVAGLPTKAALWKAIKGMCRECLCLTQYYTHLVAQCTSPKCPLFPYRLGPNQMVEASLIPGQARPHVKQAEVGGGYSSRDDEG